MGGNLRGTQEQIYIYIYIGPKSKLSVLSRPQLVDDTLPFKIIYSTIIILNSKGSCGLHGFTDCQH